MSDQPRQWWISHGRFIPDYVPDFVSDEKLEPANKDVIHVIEYSAYETLKLVNEKLRTEFDDFKKRSHTSRTQITLLMQSIVKDVMEDKRGWMREVLILQQENEELKIGNRSRENCNDHSKT